MAQPERPTNGGSAVAEPAEPSARRFPGAWSEPAGQDRPPPARSPLIALYVAFLGGVVALVRSRVRQVPRPTPGDVVLLGLSVFRLSRLVTKDKVLQSLRRPFVEAETPGASGEVNSRPRGAGVRRAVGELLSCPFCASIWLATALATGFALVPRATRLLWATLASVAVSDAAQHAYSAMQRASEEPVWRTADGAS
jgi:hypothetical protein